MWKILALLLVLPLTAWADNPDGTWLVSQRVAFDIFPCRDDLCGKIVWLRDPRLRTRENCGRTIIWGLTAKGPTEWDDGWFYDPEDGKTYTGTMTLSGNRLTTAGCVLGGMICRSVSWNRQ